MCFIKDGTISLLNGQSLKLLNHFMYLGSNILSTESDVNIRVDKAWIVIDRSYKKTDGISSKLSPCLISFKMFRAKARYELHKAPACCFEQILEEAVNKK